MIKVMNIKTPTTIPAMAPLKGCLEEEDAENEGGGSTVDTNRLVVAKCCVIVDVEDTAAGNVMDTLVFL